MLILLLQRHRLPSAEVGRGIADAALCYSERTYCNISDLTSGICVVHVVDEALPFATSKHHCVAAAGCYSCGHVVVNILVGDETLFLQLSMFIVKSL